MGSVFNVEPEKIDSSSSMDTIEDWDSLNHTNLIIALEQGFDVNFSADEIVDLLSYKLILHILNEKLNS